MFILQANFDRTDHVKNGRRTADSKMGRSDKGSEGPRDYKAMRDVVDFNLCYFRVVSMKDKGTF